MTSKLASLRDWIDERFPFTSTWKSHLSEYYAPKNFNFWYYFGSLAILVLANQVLTGIFLTMHYKADATLNASGIPAAFASVEYIMRDVHWGWLIRYMHSTGASAFFLVVYLHMFRGILYGSHRKPRELVWIFGMLIFLLLMAEAFFGYLLPWGQLSFWGAQVIVNMFSAIPLIGPDLALWLRGDYVVSDATLSRFFAFHVILVPLIILGIVVLHIVALHEVGSNNPDGIEIKKHKNAQGVPLDGIPFHPYYTVKDMVGAVLFLILFALVVFYAPEMGGYFLEYNNFNPADPLQTPQHIAPLWYLTPYYSILRSITYPLFGIEAKFWGIVAMGAAVLIFFFLPWLDRSPVRSIRYKGPIFKTAITIFAIDFVLLAFLGTKPTSYLIFGVIPSAPVAQLGTIIYFAFFLAMPWYSRRDRCKREPERVVAK